jgi:hypothetical protein
MSNTTFANGLYFLRKGDPGLIPAHPPFIEVLMTLPLLANRNLVVPSGDAASSTVSNLEFSDQLLWRVNQNGPSIVARARLPIIGLTLLLALTVYAWARELFGPISGSLALALLSFDPNILAHGSLATNDIGLTCFATLALYAFWRWMTEPTASRAVIAGLTLGLAQVSKFSAVYLIPVRIVNFATDRIWTHYLTFFNEIAGGPDNGYKILVDSNLDWGQELIGLREYMAQEKISSVKLSYHGTADPTAYGVVYEPLPSYPYNQWTSDTVPDTLLNPPSGVYAISANNLQGLRFKNHDLFATFRRRKPDAIVGHSIFIYRINRTAEANP